MRNGADDHLTSTDAARFLGVSPATVKRWSDEGVISTVRTRGGHRRFRRADVVAASERLFSQTTGSDLGRLLLARCQVLEVQGQLLSFRYRLGSWTGVAEACVPVLGSLAERRRSGGLTLLAARVAQRILEEALWRCASEMPTCPEAPRALVAPVQDREDAGVHLALTSVCLRGSCWTVWPTDDGLSPSAHELAAFVSTGAVEAAVLLAGTAQPRRVLEALVASLLPDCRRTGTALVLTGAGPWPTPPPPAVLVRTFTELQTWIDGYPRSHPGHAEGCAADETLPSPRP